MPTTYPENTMEREGGCGMSNATAGAVPSASQRAWRTGPPAGDSFCAFSSLSSNTRNGDLDRSSAVALPLAAAPRASTSHLGSPALVDCVRGHDEPHFLDSVPSWGGTPRNPTSRLASIFSPAEPLHSRRPLGFPLLVQLLRGRLHLPAPSHAATLPGRLVAPGSVGSALVGDLDAFMFSGRPPVGFENFFPKRSAKSPRSPREIPDGEASERRKEGREDTKAQPSTGRASPQPPRTGLFGWQLGGSEQPTSKAPESSQEQGTRPSAGKSDDTIPTPPPVRMRLYGKAGQGRSDEQRERERLAEEKFSPPRRPEPSPPPPPPPGSLGAIQREMLKLFAWFGLSTFFVYSLLKSRREEMSMQEFLSKYVANGLVERVEVLGDRGECRAIVYVSPPGTATPGGPAPGEAGAASPVNGSVSFPSANAGTERGVFTGLALPPHKAVVRFRTGLSAESFIEKMENFQGSLGIHPRDFLPIYISDHQEFHLFDFLGSLFLFVLIANMVSEVIFMRRMRKGGGGGPGGGAAGGLNRLLGNNASRRARVKAETVKVRFSDVAGESSREKLRKQLYRKCFEFAVAAVSLPLGRATTVFFLTEICVCCSAGLHEAKREILEFVTFLKHPQSFRRLGAKLPKGALLVGPPGTGKTLLAKVNSFPLVSVGCRWRGRGAFLLDERQRVRGDLRGRTNRDDLLDDALKRPGRFDRLVQIRRPDVAERKEIFKVHLKPLRLAPTIDSVALAERMAALTPGFVGADIANLCNEAAIQAARRRSKLGVEQRDFEAATERTIAGLPSPVKDLLSTYQRRAVAYHECGHAIAGWFLKHGNPVLKLTIIPRSSGALGFAQQMPPTVELHEKDALLDRIAVLLGGRAAEEIFIGAVSSGAADDIQKASRLARMSVMQFGMSDKLGLVDYSLQQGGEQNFYRPYSEHTAKLIDEEVNNIINDQYERVKALLKEREKEVHKLCELLINRESITYSEILECIGPRPVPPDPQMAAYIQALPTRPRLPSSEAVDVKAEAEGTDDSTGDDDGDNSGGSPDRDLDNNDDASMPEKVKEKVREAAEAVARRNRSSGPVACRADKDRTE
ncbi:Cell division protease FtsH homolog, related [Neospora caninum Liverpool]|uniref:Cell division protease FtsH homolog, related n=1 Tax=Neospora caninum (strain Liverpool) TaxID=572307 RepID=F0VFE8_NEOCL|nr:Cell division protease FtsH homolog, related [Neospora caninum Liverpool]CBZ52442.1 Cell division protease FtsH homolog, related [Neospora caninum Liverpool]|eukprot:XP_003882474.1 Cell division protease FtsH homolog, related [Neospora caninum Liverpool]